MKVRRGFVLPEVMTALVLTGVLAGALFAVVRAQTRLAAHTIDQAARADALRIASLILRAETRSLAPADIYGVGSDSLATRIYRGIAIVCTHEGDRIHVRYRGLRQPDPDKDSILIADTDAVMALSSVTSTMRNCATEDDEVDLDLHGPGPTMMPGTPLLIFETGSYWFSTRALRFRHGAEGRQPITEEVFDDRSTGFLPFGDAYTARVALRNARRAPAPAEQTTITFPSLNR